MTAQNIKTNIKIDQLLTMSLNGLDGLFFKAHKEKAKKLYKELSDGKVVDFGSLTFNDPKIVPIKLKLALDNSEFRGHLTFHLFRAVLQQTMVNLARKLEKKQNLNIFSNDNSQEIIVLTPGLIQHGGEVNVMAVGISALPQSAIIKLQFLDPDQFKKQAENTDANTKPLDVAESEDSEATESDK